MVPPRRTAPPSDLGGLRGRRCARWVRESTAAQYDNFGPDAQRDQCERAGARYGLIDTGLEWTVAASGWKTAWRTEAWQQMMAAATAGKFEVLVVGYVSRFARNLKQALIAVEDHLHPAGVPVLFADERLLSSDPDDWDQFVREAHEAESYSRRLSKRVAEGLAAKRRRLGVPGGNRAPFGTYREGRPSRLFVDDERLALVHRAYDLSAAGLSDRRVAEQVGLRLTHIRELLTNPFYAGRLRDGTPSALGALVDPAKWDKVQALRFRYARRHPGSIRRRQYALSGIVMCGGCGRRLTGHNGRYRHVDACEAFRAAAPNKRRAFSRNYDRRMRGESYPAVWYEDMVGAALRSVAVSAKLMTDTIPKAVIGSTTATDVFAAARIARDRNRATARYLRDRDVAELEAVMSRLDTEERQLQDRLVPEMSPQVAREYLGNLWKLWRKTEPEGRRAIASAAFDRIDAIGIDLVLHVSADADRYGWTEAFGSDPLVCKIGRYGRGERI